jgi:hypothetical protein
MRWAKPADAASFVYEVNLPTIRVVSRTTFRARTHQTILRWPRGRSHAAGRVFVLLIACCLHSAGKLQC